MTPTPTTIASPTCRMSPWPGTAVATPRRAVAAKTMTRRSLARVMAYDVSFGDDQYFFSVGGLGIICW